MPAYKGKEKYIFVSYAHKDSEKVLPIIENMQHAGFRIWYDTGIEAGTEWPAYIEESLEKSAVVLAFISSASIESINCRNEINYALLKHKEMLVIYLENAELKYGLGLQLNALQSLYRFRHTTEKSFLDELIKAKILQDCRRNGASFEEMRRMSMKNGKKRAVLKTVLIVDEKHVDSVVTENEKRDRDTVSLEKYKAEEARIAEEKRKAEEAARIAEEKRKAEETRIAEEKRKAEEARIAEEKRKAEEARMAEEKHKAEEAARIAEEKRKSVCDHQYNEAVALMEREEYAEAIAIFETLGDYKDSSEKIAVCKSEMFLLGKYYEADILLARKNYASAYEVFSGLGHYKDSVEKAKKAKKLIKKSSFIAQFQEGNTLKFGSYPQNNSEREDIEWQVLDVRSGKALLISKYALDCRKYNINYTKVTWETCDLRKWLNHDFFESAFSENERSMILTSASALIEGSLVCLGRCTRR